MDPILQTLLSWQFIFFGLSISAVVFVIRKIVEYVMSQSAVIAKESTLWNKLLLPIMPIILGGFIGLFFKLFPYPDGLTLKWDRVMFGVVAGLLSTFMYGTIKALFQQKIAGAIGSITGITAATVAPASATPAAPAAEASPDTSAKPTPTGPTVDQ